MIAGGSFTPGNSGRTKNVFVNMKRQNSGSRGSEIGVTSLPQKMWITLWISGVPDHIRCRKPVLYSTLHLFRSVLTLLKKVQSAIKHRLDRKSTRLNSSHGYISYAVFCLKKKKKH